MIGLLCLVSRAHYRNWVLSMKPSWGRLHMLTQSETCVICTNVILTNIFHTNDVATKNLHITSANVILTNIFHASDIAPKSMYISIPNLQKQLWRGPPADSNLHRRSWATSLTTSKLWRETQKLGSAMPSRLRKARPIALCVHCFERPAFVRKGCSVNANERGNAEKANGTRLGA